MSFFYISKKVLKKYWKRSFRYIKWKWRKIRKSNALPFLQIHLTEHCNLNCRSCAHYSPIAEKEIISLKKLERSYKKLQPYLETWFSQLELMGGEPLLHPQIEDILLLTRQYFPNIEIHLVTNGIKLSEMPEKFYNACRKNNIKIFISIYPINLDREKIKNKMEYYGIDYDYYGKYDACKTFTNYRLDPKGKCNPKWAYWCCEFGGRCLQLKDDRIYPCFLSAYAEHLNRRFGTHFIWGEKDYISLDCPITEEAFHDFINEAVPFCRYCVMKHLTKSEWTISKEEKEEWIV